MILLWSMLSKFLPCAVSVVCGYGLPACDHWTFPSSQVSLPKWHHGELRNQRGKRYLDHGICKHYKSGLDLLFYWSSRLKRWKNINNRLHFEVWTSTAITLWNTHTHTQKNGENLPVFENYDCLQHRSHLHRWQMNRIATYIFLHFAFIH